MANQREKQIEKIKNLEDQNENLTIENSKVNKPDLRSNPGHGWDMSGHNPQLTWKCVTNVEFVPTMA